MDFFMGVCKWKNYEKYEIWAKLTRIVIWYIRACIWAMSVSERTELMCNSGLFTGGGSIFLHNGALFIAGIPIFIHNGVFSIAGVPIFVRNGALFITDSPIFIRSRALSIADGPIFVCNGVLSFVVALYSCIMIHYPSVVVACDHSRIVAKSNGMWLFQRSGGRQRPCEQGLASVSKLIHASISYYLLWSISHHLRLT